MTFPRRTLLNPVTVEGLGLHGGAPVTLTVNPGESGLWFRLGSERVQARPENVSDTVRCTRLGSIATVEHLMSAFAGLGVTDAEVELTAPELPALDGSALGYVTALAEAGVVDTGEFEVPALFSRLFVHENDVKIAIGKGEGFWRYAYDLGDRWPGLQEFEMEPGTYETEVAPARTFALAEELPPIIQAGLGRGLDADSALVIGIEGYKNEPRFPDEPARHKLLDLIGDLYLSGVPIAALDVVAERSGHRTNVMAAKTLLQATRASGPAHAEA